MINSLAALKRALEVGKVLKIVNHSRNELIGTERTISLTQTNGYWFTQPGEEPPQRWWAAFPKASDFEFHEDGSFSIFFQRPAGERPPIFARLAFIS